MSEWYVQVGEDVGRALTRLAPLMGTLLLPAAYWGEVYAVPGVLASVAVTFALGWVLSRLCQPADDASKAEVFASAGAVWLAAVLVGTLPFLTVAWTVGVNPGFASIPPSAADPTLRVFQDPVNAWFESMSGFTGSGLTMARKESELPHTIQWWRSLSQWLGGLGVIVLTVAIVNESGNSMLSQYYEDRSPLGQFQSDDQSNDPKLLVGVFTVATLLAAALFWAVGMPVWDSLNHAMTGLATGGFSVTDNSIATYDSAVIEYALWPVMLLGSIAFPIHYLILRGDLRNLYADLQTRWVFGSFAVGSVAMVAVLVQSGAYDGVAAALRYGGFQFISAMSCTGFQSAPISEWSVTAQLVLSGGMTVGAAAGSTAGGIKLVRLLTLLKGTAFRISGVFYPASAVRRFRFDGRVLTDTEASQEFEEAAIVAFLWVLFLLLGIVVLLAVVPDSYTLENVVFEIASTQGNVGLSTGIVGPDMSPIAKGTLLFNMWIGRLEIIPVLVALRALLTRGRQ